MNICTLKIINQIIKCLRLPIPLEFNIIYIIFKANLINCSTLRVGCSSRIRSTVF